MSDVVSEYEYIQIGYVEKVTPTCPQALFVAVRINMLH
jgi:hypothetical protein